MGFENIADTIKDIQKAKENLVRIKRDYEYEPDIMNFYLPSAKQMISELENHLNYLISQELDKEFQVSTNYSADLWIRLEGKQIGVGKGPIGVVGAYLQRLNTANRHAIKLIKGTEDILEKITDKFSDLFSFDLVATGKGSLKLGLRTPSLHELLSHTEEQQLSLFNEENEDSIDKLMEIDRLNQLSMDGFKLLLKTLNSVVDESSFADLQEKYAEKDLLKLLHYAKDLVPSSWSSFDSVSFEGENLGIPSSVLKTDKNTRKRLIERENKLKQDTEYITGKGWLRALDLDELTGVIRPFHFKNKNIEKIDFRVSEEEYSSDQLASLLDKFVNITGFLVYNKNFDPHRIDIEEISIEDHLDNEEEEFVLRGDY